MAAAKARRVFAWRVNCNAMGVPGIAASSSRMPTLASGVSGKMRTSRKHDDGNEQAQQQQGRNQHAFLR
jgi:hypothetical protein